jgi:superfamily II DNA or RNA helicase
MRSWRLHYHEVPPKDVLEQYQSNESVNRLKTVPDVEIDTSNLLSFQIDGVKRIVAAMAKHRRACDLSEGGIGKTYMACAAARHFKLRILVVCPTVVVADWRKVAAIFGVKVFDIVSWEKMRMGKCSYYQYEEINGLPEAVYKLPEDVMIILDEAHRAKGQNSLNSLISEAATRTKNYGLLLTATLATGAHELKANGQFLGLHQGGYSYEIWKHKNGVKSGRFGDMQIGGSSFLEEIHEALIPYRGNRIRVADLGDLFPDTQISANAYSAGAYTPKIQAVYQQLKEEIEEIEQNDTSGNKSMHILVRMLKARMKAERLKVPMFYDLATEFIEAGYSVALFMNFNRSISMLADRLKTNLIIRGGQTHSQREAVKEMFQSNKGRVIVCNIRAGGSGLSLHDLHGDHPRVALISPTWSAFDLRQATFRVNRANGKSKSIQRIVFAADTIEEDVMLKVEKKLANLDSINDGDLALFDDLYSRAKIQDRKLE